MEGGGGGKRCSVEGVRLSPEMLFVNALQLAGCTLCWFLTLDLDTFKFKTEM